MVGIATECWNMACLWHFSVLVFNNKSLITGVILDASLPDYSLSQKKSAVKIVSTYFRQPLTAETVILQIGSDSFETTTNSHGSFSLYLENQVHEEVKVYLKEKAQYLPAIQIYPQYFGPRNEKLAVISDIDDTIMVSHTASLTKRVKTILTPIKERKTIDFTHGLISQLVSDEGRIYYVSKSEYNLFEMISRIILQHGLPVGHLFLTPYLKFNQLLNPKKGKAFKTECIKFILDHSKNTKFVLVGDDTQRDMDVYTEIARLYPGQIVKIYIRNTGKGLLHRKRQLKKKLHLLKVPYLYYSDNDDFEAEINIINQLIRSS